MAIIKSGASSDQLTIDATSKAARMSPYDSGGVYRGPKPVYRAASIAPFVAAVTVNTPWFLIEGSASKVITVHRMTVSGTSLTAVAYIAVNVAKFSSAASGGTATTAPQVALDSNSAAGTASLVKYYTVAPTTGTLVGSIDTRRTLMQATVAVGTSIFNTPMVFEFGDHNEIGGVVLRGTSQGLGLIWPVAPATAVTLSASVEWTEE